MGSITFTTTLVTRGPGIAVVLDDDVAVVGEGAKRFPVAATVNDHTWRTTVVRMRGEFLLGLSKDVREQARVRAGERTEATVALDTEERTVEVPAPLADALTRDGAASAAWERLAYTHRKEFARWVAEAKRDETCERRVERALEMLRAGETRS